MSEARFGSGDPPAVDRHGDTHLAGVTFNAWPRYQHGAPMPPGARSLPKYRRMREGTTP